MLATVTHMFICRPERTRQTVYGKVSRELSHSEHVSCRRLVSSIIIPIRRKKKGGLKRPAQGHTVNPGISHGEDSYVLTEVSELPVVYPFQWIYR